MTLRRELRAGWVIKAVVLQVSVRAPRLEAEVDLAVRAEGRVAEWSSFHEAEDLCRDREGRKASTRSGVRSA